LLPPPISDAADPLKPFEQTILSNEFSFAHFLGYMDSFLPLMKKANLTVSDLRLNETYIHGTLHIFSFWYGIGYTGDERKRLFLLCLKDMSCVLLLLKDPLTSVEFDIVIQKVLK
jgi:hypothetical protein